MSTSTSEGEILTIKQVADYLKVTERTIYRLAAAKKIPAFKVGGTWRFSRPDIDRWIKHQSMEGLSTGGDVDDTADGQLHDGERK
jgi:excisionase family DNA binding protein